MNHVEEYISIVHFESWLFCDSAPVTLIYFTAAD